MPLVTHAVTLLLFREGVSLFTLLQSHWYGYMHLPLTEMRPSASRFTIGTYGKMSYTSWRVWWKQASQNDLCWETCSGPHKEIFHLLNNSIAGKSSLFCCEETSRVPMQNMTELSKQIYIITLVEGCRVSSQTDWKMSYTSWRVLMEASIPRWPLLENLQWPTQRNVISLINSIAGNSSLSCGEETSQVPMHNSCPSKYIITLVGGCRVSSQIVIGNCCWLYCLC